MLFHSLVDFLWEFEPERIGKPGPVFCRWRGLAAMRIDHSTAGDPDGDLIVGEVAYLNQKVAYYERVQRSRHEWSHGAASDRLTKQQLQDANVSQEMI